MKRKLLGALLLAGVLFVGVVGAVLLRADPTALPAPDPALPIRLPDGSTRPLAQVLQLSLEAQPLVPPGAGPAEAPDAAPPEARSQASVLFELADLAVDEGRLDEAAALYLSIPEGDPLYPHAQRRVGWNVLSVGKRQPRRAVSYVHASLAASPFDNDVWEDVARVYVATLGIDTSGWD